MKTTEFVNKDGETKFQNVPEAGDIVTARYSQVMEHTGGKFKNFSLGVVHNGEDKYIKITNGQKKQLFNTDLLNKTLEFYEYENEYGKNVGVRVN